MQDIKLTTRDVKEKIAKSGFFCSEITSNSMSPLLKTGDKVIVRAFGAGGPRFADIVVFESGGTLCAHRYFYTLKVNGKIICLVSKGDNCRTFDNNMITVENMLGKVASIVKGNKIIDMDNFLCRYVNYMAGILSITLGAIVKALVFLKSNLLKNRYIRRARIARKGTEYAAFFIVVGCEVKCPMCATTYLQDKYKGILSFDNFVKILDKLPDLKAADLSGRGESLLAPHFFEMAEYLKKNGIVVTFSTNLSYLPDEFIEKILALRINDIYVSFNSLKKDISEKLKNGIRFETVLENLNRLIRERENKNIEYPRIILHALVNKHNINETTDLIDYTKKIKADGIFFSMVEHRSDSVIAVSAVNDLKVPFYKYLKSMEDAALYAKRAGVTMHFDGIIRPRECVIPWSKNLLINWNGDVWPACRHSLKDFDRPFGNILKEDNVNRIFRSPEFRRLRKELAGKKVPKICEISDACSDV